MTAVKTTSTFVLVRDEHGFKGGADVDCPCLHSLWLKIYPVSSCSAMVPVEALDYRGVGTGT